MVLTRIGVASAAKITGMVYTAIGLLAGMVMASFSVVMTRLGPAMTGADSQMPALFGAIFGVGAIVVLPIFYGAMGLIFGAIGAALYNLFAGLVGGVQLELR